MLTRRAAILSTASAAALVPAASQAAVLAPLTFTVLRDEQRIGTHRVEFHREGSGLRVGIAIDLEVRMLSIPVYRYVHRSTEHWRDGRLVGLDATTNDDGTRTTVRAKLVDGRLAVEGSGGRFTAAPETKPTSYWHEDMTRRQRFLDTQNGTLLEVAVRPLGATRTMIAGQAVDMRAYELTGDLTSRLGYSQSGEWIDLRFTARGSLISYRRDAPPAASAVSPSGPPLGRG